MDKLIEQYKLDKIIDKDRIIHDLSLISKKILYMIVQKTFLSLIEMTKVEQEEFTQKNKTIIKYLKNPKLSNFHYYHI